ncbi:DUF6301 family protein [Actinomadura miaoliensis]|uniref:SnoaL-like domain-containing protein n=1 Tax=Actinomadura miaoliensis TaxID=430685 RepID=A0ABP7V4G8_9ACTN
MAEHRRLSDREVVELVTRFRDLAWSWNAADVDQLVHDFGWTVEARRRRGVRLDTGLGMASGDINITSDGQVERVSVAASEYVSNETIEGRSWLQDVFADVTAIATKTLGEPTDRRPGEYPEVRWRGQQTTIVVMRSSTLVKIFVATNEYLDEHDWAVSQGL